MTNPISDLEMIARTLIEQIGDSLEETVVKVAMRALWGYGSSAERIKTVGLVILNLHRPELNIQPTLTKLCRQKILRSRISSGVRIYEINFNL